MKLESRLELFLRGRTAVQKFVETNDLPPVATHTGPTGFSACAYYRDSEIYIDIEACARIGMGGPAWSFPGYVIDRTPFGVMAHELGHHVDVAHGSRPGILSPFLYRETKEKAISGYAPNVNEWFAEIFRLFVTNPDLLRLIRPKIYERLKDRFKTIEDRPWDQIVTLERQQKAARNKIAEVKAQQELF